MRERLFYDVTEEQKKEILIALKNEQKYSKKLNIYDRNDEVIAKTLKWDVYTKYLDFWLEDFIDDDWSEVAGRIKNIELYDFTNNKGIILKRIKKITT